MAAGYALVQTSAWVIADLGARAARGAPAGRHLRITGWDG